MVGSSKKAKGERAASKGVSLGFEHPQNTRLEERMIRISVDLGHLLKEISDFERTGDLREDGDRVADFVERFLSAEQQLITTASECGAKRFIREGVPDISPPSINMVAIVSIDTIYIRNHREERWISFVVFLHDTEVELMKKFIPQEGDEGYEKAGKGYLAPGEFPQELAQLGLSAFGDIKSRFSGIVAPDGHIVPALSDREIAEIVETVLHRPIPPRS